jgi:hypothetical protein
MNGIKHIFFNRTRDLLLCVVLTFVSISAIGQMETIVKGLEEGQAQAVSQYFSDEVWLCIIDFEDSVNSNEASSRLSQFFNNYKVIEFNQLHNGGSSSHEHEVVIGKLKTNNGNFRVYIYLDGEKNKQIDEFRIED